MKKFLLFVFILLLISLTALNVNNNIKFFSSVQGKYCAYVSSALALGSLPNGFETIQNGNGYIISTTLKARDTVLNSITSLSGESVELDGNIYSLSQIKDLLKLKTASAEKLSSGTLCVYGYANGFDKCVKISGKKVNVQIAVTQDKIIVGFPLILGSY